MILSAFIHTAASNRPTGYRPLTANQDKRKPGREGAKVRRVWRDAAARIWAEAGAAAGIEALPPGCVIEVWPRYTDRNYGPDVGAQFPTFKAAIDGLRAPTAQEAKRGIEGACLIPDDGPEWIAGVVWHPAEGGYDRHGLYIEVHGPDDDGDDGPGGGGDSTAQVEGAAVGPVGDTAEAMAAAWADMAAALDDAAGLDDAERWAVLRDSACHAAQMAWDWATDYAARVSMRSLANMTGIARPTLIRWTGWSSDDKSMASDPASTLLRMLHPVEYKRQLEDEGRGSVAEYRPKVRNGGPWLIPHSDPPAFTQVLNGRWSWISTCGATGGVASAGFEDALQGDGERYDDQADALAGYWGWVDREPYDSSAEADGWSDADFDPDLSERIKAEKAEAEAEAEAKRKAAKARERKRAKAKARADREAEANGAEQ